MHAFNPETPKPRPAGTTLVTVGKKNTGLDEQHTVLF
jgi:hypothetical protein